MFSITELIDDTISELARRPFIFSAPDVSAHADLSERDTDIERALRLQCDSQSILPLDEQPYDGCRYLGMTPVENWWIESTLRWAKAGVDCLTPAQLAREMALAFDVQNWTVPPASLMAVGRQRAMIADGYNIGTCVFPWATVIHNNPKCKEEFRSIADSQGLSWESAIDEVLSSLSSREADIVRSRRGFDTGRTATLEQIGNRYGLTRERIRQVELEAYRKLRHPSRNRHLWRAFAAYFVHSGGSLITPDIAMASRYKFLLESIGMKTTHVPEFGLHIIADESEIYSYRKVLRDIPNYLGIALESPCFAAMGSLQFLSQHDGEQVSNAEKEYRTQHTTKTRPYMLREALRTLGRAAHFSEIADICNQMFTENQTSTHNWHASLGRPDAEAIGIVWIGSKGMYGLKEHGYSRPDSDMFVAVAEIVADQFAKTLQPVAFDFVMAELSKQRRELKRSSVVMALSFNDRVESVGRDEYVPKICAHDQFSDTGRIEYDIDVAFEAFSSSEDSLD